jgi:hypothetical protein
MQATERLIKNVESKWLESLQENCRKVFLGVHLPSHDETHHTHVWQQARLLIKELDKKGITFHEVEIEKLILAVFFHDTGMSETLQKDHGKISRRIAKEFLKDKELHGLELNEVLDAIEHHDKKDYSVTNMAGQPEFNLQSMLNICDDLDALGVLGVYRYCEIYLLRHIAVTEISDAVLENLQARFQHMKIYLGFSPHFLKLQNQRYIVSRNFFKDLHFQLKQGGDNATDFTGPLGVVNFFKEFIFRQKLHLADTTKNALLISSDFYVSHFFEKLEKELHDLD